MIKKSFEKAFSSEWFDTNITNLIHELIIMEAIIPWEKIVSRLYQFYDDSKGAVSKSLRMMTAILIVMKYYQLSDRNIIKQIKENRYIQYFCNVPDEGLLTFLHSSESGFAKRQILLVIFEMHFDFPSFLIAIVNPYGIVEKFIADKHVTNDFPVLQTASAHYRDYLAVNVVTSDNSLIMMIFFQISPLTSHDLFYDFRRLKQHSLRFEFISVISFADNTESGSVSGIHDFLHMIGAVEEQFNLSEVVSLSVACFFQTNDLISCDIVFRPVIGMLRRQLEDEGERDSRFTGDR